VRQAPLAQYSSLQRPLLHVAEIGPLLVFRKSARLPRRMCLQPEQNHPIVDDELPGMQDAGGTANMRLTVEENVVDQAMSAVPIVDSVR